MKVEQNEGIRARSSSTRIAATKKIDWVAQSGFVLGRWLGRGETGSVLNSWSCPWTQEYLNFSLITRGS